MIKGEIFNIMVGSPGDESDIARKAIECIHKWNVLNTYERHIALVPHHWTSSSYPTLRKPAQAHLNDIIVDRSDALVAIFGSRLGTPTENYESGTVEEIEEHRKAGKPVMVFFCENFDFNQDIEQIKKVQEYRNTLSNDGLYETFKDVDDFEKKFTNHLIRLVQVEFQPHINHNEDADAKEIFFSEEELDLIRQWVNTNSNYLSINPLMGGRISYSFSGLAVDADTPMTAAQMDDFIRRMSQAGYIEEDGVNKQGKQKYRLTLKAYEVFRKKD